MRDKGTRAVHNYFVNFDIFIEFGSGFSSAEQCLNLCLKSKCSRKSHPLDFRQFVLPWVLLFINCRASDEILSLPFATAIWNFPWEKSPALPSGYGLLTGNVPLDPDPFKSIHEAPRACWFSIFLGRVTFQRYCWMSTELHDTSAFSQNLPKMRIFLVSSSQKCERMGESPFENQTKLNQKSPSWKEFKNEPFLSFAWGF